MAKRASNCEEIEILIAIFGDELVQLNEKTYSINIRNNHGNEVYFQVTLCEGYPLCSPPIYQISAPWMSGESKKRLYSKIDDIYSQHIGEHIIYLWIKAIEDFIEKICYKEKRKNKICIKHGSTKDIEHETGSISLLEETTMLPVIEHSETIQDRKSVFQGHLARIVSEKQVQQVLQKLKENRKIASAKHNIYAYRISSPDNCRYIEDYNDDGESKAGPRILHLLKVLNVSGIMVIVTRWYGGIHLGPDRFKHINNAARNVLWKAGFIKSEREKMSKDN